MLLMVGFSEEPHLDAFSYQLAFLLHLHIFFSTINKNMKTAHKEISHSILVFLKQRENE
jgi:hypothetical protein